MDWNTQAPATTSWETVELPFSFMNPYLIWARNILYNEKGLRHAMSYHCFAQSLGRVTRRPKPVKILYYNTIDPECVKPILERKLKQFNF